MALTNYFKFDVFLSYSSKDKAVVRPVAERLRKDELKVWFDEWEIKPGDSIPARIEEGLEHSRVLVICMSANAFGSDWAQLEASTFRFRDPLNKDRRFIPLRLDDAPIKGSLAQLLYIDWRHSDREQEYSRLLDACRPNMEMDQFHANCMGLLDKVGMSERMVVSGLLSEIDSFLKNQPFNRRQFHWGIIRTVSTIIVQRQNYKLLLVLKSKVDECLSRNTSTATDLMKCISDFRSSLSDALEALAANGAKNIESGDTILLYAHSQSVHAAINKWLQENPMGTLKLIFCQCIGKSVVADRPFGHAVYSANQIPYRNARIFFALDSAVGSLISSGRIKKVFFGAYQWCWVSHRRAWFTNTPGTLAIASTANKFGVPIFILAETQKTQIQTPDSNHDGTSHRCLKHRDERPIKTKYRLPIEYEETSADEIDSKSIPFILITEQGEFACADYGLRKRNRVIVDRNGLLVNKITTDRTTARSEKIVLEVLGNMDTNTVPKFQVPMLLTNTRGGSMWASVSMHCKAGVRMHDLIATLNALVRRNGREVVQKANTFREKVCKWAMSDVHTWQSPMIQSQLRERFGPQEEVYEFENKLKEAVSYVWNYAGKTSPLDQILLKEIDEFASRLRHRASLFLRDASLKNQILELGCLLGPHLPPRCKTVGYFPLVDDQWFDLDVAELLLNRITHEISWEDVRSHIWQVDFEQASRLTTPEDDFIHVLAHEVFSFDYDQIVKIISEQLKNVSPEHVHETMLFRCFRAWARRLFYCREEPETFATRYRHESLAHCHRLAQTAAGKLQNTLGRKLLSFIHHT